jgi:hypothetical protein
MLYEMVTGQRPYPAGNIYQLIEAVARNQPIVLPRILRGDLPKECEEVIMEGLAHDREVRVQTVKELVTRFAAGIPNGTALLAYAAPRLVRSTAEPTAKTISGALGPAAIQWSAAVDASARAASAREAITAKRTRHIQALILAAVAVGCLSVGVLFERMRHGRAPAQVVAVAPVPVDAPSMAVNAVSPPIAKPAAAIDAAPVVAAVAVAPPPPLDAPLKVAPDAPVDARPPVPVLIDAAPANVASVPKPPVAAATKGTLVVKVEPFADVVIDGTLVGAAPVTRQLTAGDHTVRLTGPNDRTETIRVRIAAGKTQLIRRMWQE